jgi:DNA modification methylase
MTLFDDLDLWLDNLLDVDEEQENQAPELSEKPRVQQWDVFQLWDHRLVVWDATNLETVQLLMEDQKANLIITDPPYNVNYEWSTGMKIQNDDMSKDSFYQFLYDAFTNMYMVQEDGASVYVFHADTEWENFRKAFTDAGFKLAQCLIRVKNALVMGRQDYHWKHEPILYGRKPTAWHNWYTDRSQTTVWNFDKPLKNDLHPTMKPIDIITYPITNSSKNETESWICSDDLEAHWSLVKRQTDLLHDGIRWKICTSNRGKILRLY